MVALAGTNLPRSSAKDLAPVRGDQEDAVEIVHGRGALRAGSGAKTKQAKEEERPRKKEKVALCYRRIMSGGGLRGRCARCVVSQASQCAVVGLAPRLAAYWVLGSWCCDSGGPWTNGRSGRRAGSRAQQQRQ